MIHSCLANNSMLLDCKTCFLFYTIIAHACQKNVPNELFELLTLKMSNGYKHYKATSRNIDILCAVEMLNFCIYVTFCTLEAMKNFSLASKNASYFKKQNILLKDRKFCSNLNAFFFVLVHCFCAVKIVVKNAERCHLNSSFFLQNFHRRYWSQL